MAFAGPRTATASSGTCPSTSPATGAYVASTASPTSCSAGLPETTPSRGTLARPSSRKAGRLRVREGVRGTWCASTRRPCRPGRTASTSGRSPSPVGVRPTGVCPCPPAGTGTASISTTAGPTPLPCPATRPSVVASSATCPTASRATASTCHGVCRVSTTCTSGLRPASTTTGVTVSGRVCRDGTPCSFAPRCPT